MGDVTLFVGPSAFGVPPQSLAAGDVRIKPPVRRGDVDRLVDVSAPGVVVVCDGVFQCEPAVSHAELCRALDAGWQVWGVSSIGAIRAFELRGEGMCGFGYVRSMFDRHPDFADDEMCLLHAPQSPWWPLSEALINLRYALERRKRALGIADASERRLLAALRELWFGDRTEPRIRALMAKAGVEPAAAQRLLDWLPTHRVKTLDLVRLMSLRPWASARRRES